MIFLHIELDGKKFLADNKQALLGELVVGDLKVEGCGALPDPARGVVVGAVAGAVVAAKLAGVGDGHAAQVGAHAKDDEPFGVLDTFVVLLGVSQRGGVDAALGLNLLRSSGNSKC